MRWESVYICTCQCHDSYDIPFCTAVVQFSSCYEYELPEPLTAYGRVLYLHEGQEILWAGLSRSIGSAADLCTQPSPTASCITIDHIDQEKNNIVMCPTRNSGGSSIFSLPAMACDSGSLSAEFVSDSLGSCAAPFFLNEQYGSCSVWSGCGDNSKSCRVAVAEGSLSITA